MRSDIEKAINLSLKCGEQGSLDWKRQRLGNFTGSQVGRLMKSGRGKDEVFGKDAISYIDKVGGDRALHPAFVMNDEELEEYLGIVDPSSRTMDWGKKREPDARGLYEHITGNTVTLCGAMWVNSLRCFADSPDGVVIDKDGCIEIKCQMPSTSFHYQRNVTDAESLKAENPQYYWQCISHMLVTGAAWCDFIVYCPMQYNKILGIKPMHVVRLERNEDEIRLLTERILLAEERLTSGQISSCHSL